MINTNKPINENDSNVSNLKKLQLEVKEVKKELLKPDVTKKKSWMTTEILNLMEERTKNKGNPSEYGRTQCIIRQEIRNTKEQELMEKCIEIEYHQSKHENY